MEQNNCQRRRQFAKHLTHDSEISKTEIWIILRGLYTISNMNAGRTGKIFKFCRHKYLKVLVYTCKGPLRRVRGLKQTNKQTTVSKPINYLAKHWTHYETRIRTHSVVKNIVQPNDRLKDRMRTLAYIIWYLYYLETLTLTLGSPNEFR